MQKLLLIMVLLIPCFFIKNESAEAVKKNRAYWESTGDIIWDVHTAKKLIALTFDDGPHPKYTRQILNILNSHNAKATFFVVGQRAAAYPSLLREMKEKKHEIANHTYGHPTVRNASLEQLREEIKKTDETIHSITGKYPSLFRPPGGEYNEKVVTAAKTGKHLVVMWSWTQDTKDWSNPGTNRIITRVCKNARPGNIVLFHDFGRDRTQTVRAVEAIVEKLSKEGYEFVTVSELLSRTNQIVPTRR